MSENQDIALPGMDQAQTQGRTLDEVAEAIGATLVRGEPKTLIRDIATLETAGPDQITFIASEKHAAAAVESKAGAFVAAEPIDVPGRPLLRVGNAWEAVRALAPLFRPAPPIAQGVDPTAKIGHGTDLGPDVSIGPYAVIGANVSIGAHTAIGAGATVGDNTRIGENGRIHPGVQILHNVQIGANAIIHSGAVIGSDGFKFEMVAGRPLKIPQMGKVVIGDDVEIGANCTIDRAFLDATRIGDGVKMDNMVHIAHNVQVGRNCLFAAQVGIAGSTIIGDGCVFAGKASAVDNVRIGNNVQVGGLSAIKDDTPDGAVMFGIPALPLSNYSRMLAGFKRLPELLKRVRKLEKKLGD